MSKPEIGVYLPQMGFTYEQVLHRTLRCEQLGIDSIWLYDHLYAPGMPDYPSMEAWTLATALLSRTERIRIGHMVLCNQFRHPAVLAKMATTLDQISAGRLQLGIGSGSIEDEHSRLGLALGDIRRAVRTSRRDAADPASGVRDEVIDFTGRHFTVKDMPIKPGPVAAAKATDRRRRGRREVHAAVGRALCRCLERPDVCAGRTRAQDLGAAVDLRRGRPRPVDHRDVDRGGDGSGRRTTHRCPKCGSSPRSVSAYRHSGSRRAAWSARRPRSSTACTSCRSWASARSCCSPTTADPTRPSTCSPPR